MKQTQEKKGVDKTFPRIDTRKLSKDLRNGADAALAALLVLKVINSTFVSVND